MITSRYFMQCIFLPPGNGSFWNCFSATAALGTCQLIARHMTLCSFVQRPRALLMPLVSKWGNKWMEEKRKVFYFCGNWKSRLEVLFLGCNIKSFNLQPSKWSISRLFFFPSSLLLFVPLFRSVGTDGNTFRQQFVAISCEIHRLVPWHSMCEYDLDERLSAGGVYGHTRFFFILHMNLCSKMYSAAFRFIPLKSKTLPQFLSSQINKLLRRF